MRGLLREEWTETAQHKPVVMRMTLGGLEDGTMK